MGLGLQTIIQHFNSYLEGLNELSTKEYNTSSNSEISIFLYSNEFKNYLADEVEVDPRIYSMSVNDILNMEIENGKLVDPNKKEETTGVQTETDDQALEQTETDVAETEEAAGDNTQEYGENPTIKMGEKPVTDFLNDIMELDNVKEVIDADANGEVSDEEVKSFINAIKGYDGDGENVSLEDILGAMQAINNGEFSLDPEKAEEKELEVKEQKEAEQAQIAQNANGATGSSGNRGVSGSGGVGGANSNIASQGTQEKTLDNMSKEELNAELKTAESDLSDKQSKLSAILDGSDSELQKLQDDIDDKYEIYHDELEKLDEDLAKDIDDKKSEIEDKEKEIDDKEQEISDQECTVRDCENNYNNAVSTRETLETALEALKSADTSNMDDSKKAELSSKISELESKVEDAKQDEQDAKDAWDEAEEKLNTLQDEKTELESGDENSLQTLEEEMAELENQVLEKYPQIQEYMDAYNESKENYKETKQNAITTAKADIEESQEYVNEVKTAISNYDNKQTAKEYCFGDFGEEVLEYAKQFIGYNEADGSADIFTAAWNSSSSATPWCAAFVDYIMSNSGNYDDVPDWYKNIDNKWYCPNVYNAANAAGAIINGQEVQQGDIVLFDWDGDGTSDHIGIVDSTENGTVVTIEGNTSDQVAQRTYDINDSRLTFCKIVA